jgi:hypothetical protein
MTTLLDRAFQRQLLNELASIYPRNVDVERSFADDLSRAKVNLAYLAEHGLVVTVAQDFMDGDYAIISAKISAKGLDFLADDGGLSAVLGVVTVRLHEDTIKGILIDKVQQSPGDDTVKSRLVEAINKQPAEALSTLTTKLLEASLSQLPTALPLLQRLLGLG